MRLQAAYEPHIIREYRYWTLLLNTKQIPYVGRSYVWFKDTDVLKGDELPLHRLPIAAVMELHFKIFADMLKACGGLGHKTGRYGSEFLLNTCYLANELGHNHHMHFHFIPRFSRPIVIQDIDLTCEDRLWGQNYAYIPREEEKHVEGERFHYIRDAMAQAIGRNV